MMPGDGSAIHTPSIGSASLANAVDGADRVSMANATSPRMFISLGGGIENSGKRGMTAVRMREAATAR